MAVGIQQRPMATETGAAFVPARSFLVRTNPYYGGEARGTTNVIERTANKRDEITIGEIKRAFSGRGVIVNFVKYFICRSSERPLRLKNEKDFTESACVCARARVTHPFTVAYARYVSDSFRPAKHVKE